jgi:hypothetical protein
MNLLSKIYLIIYLIFLLNNLFAQQLNHYTCFVDRIEISKWLKNGKRSFDKNGVIKNNKQYHPLGIVHYGLLNHNEFLKTKDSSYYYKLLDQISYFKDTSKIDLSIDGKGIGLPYNYKHADLTPPWYSGMTQGSALSLLLRYRSLTNDKEIDSIIEKIAYQMISPVDKNGSIGKTSEGYTWIEEYPNSKKSPQVLNGFINGLIGLKEYTDHFTKDTLAKRIHDECYESLKLCLSKYDMNNWSNYNRKKNSRCTVLYLRYEIMEMKHLFEVYQDSIFLDQMKIWSSYTDGKPMKTKRTDLKLKSYYHAKKTVYSKNTNTYSVKYNIDTLGYWCDSLNQKSILKKIKNQKRKSIFKISSDTSKSINYIILKSENDIVLKNLFLKNKKGKWEKINAPIHKNNLYIKLKESEIIQDLHIKLKHHSSFKLVEITLSKIKKYQMPLFYYYKTKETLVKGKYEFVINNIANLEDITIFYKSAKNENAKQQKKWIATNCIKGDKGIFEVNDDNKFHEFMVVYQPTQIHSTIGKIEFTKLE